MSDLLPTNVTLLQPASRYFRLDQALQALDIGAQVNSQIAPLQADITTLQSQVATLQSQMTTVQGQIAAQQQTINSFNWVQLEVDTGLTFLDGRTLYTRSFVISGALNTALNVFTYAHGISAINYVAQISAIAGQNNGQNLPITFINAQQVPNVQDAISIFADITNIYVFNGSVLRTNFLVLVKMYYTCTDR